MKINQILHGYQDGHGRLAGSVQNITPQDAALMSQMSDWSGYRDPAGKDNSYLTAYPLKESGYYVVAKSWYASEMERPGSVWTHSLLIELYGISSQFDFRMLDKLFQRPTRGDYGQYNKGIELDIEQSCEKNWDGSKVDNVSMMFMLSTLLTGEEKFFLRVEHESEWNQQMCLTYLQFLPTGILKRITISSGSSSPRKMANELLSMQFVTMNEGLSLVSPPWSDRLVENDFSVGLRFVTFSMKEKEEDVSSLIKVFSKDIGEDGKKYVGVCLLLEMLYRGTRKKGGVSYNDVIGTISVYFPGKEDGNLVKVNFLRNRIAMLYCKSEQESLFDIVTFVDSEEHFTEEQIALWERVSALEDENKDGYRELIGWLVKGENVKGYAKQILTDSFNRFAIEEIVEMSDTQWEQLLPYLKDNEGFLLSDKWLGMNGGRFNDVLWTFLHSDNDGYQYWENLLSVIMERRDYVDESLTDMLYSHIPDCVERVLDYLNGQNTGENRGNLYVRPFQQTDKMLEWMSKQERISSDVEDMIVTYFNPYDERVVRSVSSMWRWMVSNDDGRKALDYYIYLFIMAYNWRGQDALDGFYHSYARVHQALGEPQTSDRVWQYVSRYGGKVSIFHEWDRCRKLRNGIVEHLKAFGFPKSVLKDFTPNKEINETLVKIYG